MGKYKNSIIIFCSIILLVLHVIKYFYFKEKISTLVLSFLAISLLLVGFIKKEKEDGHN
jgi:hypothetical protein